MPRLSVERSTATHVTISGREYLNFGGCNYMGFTEDPRVHQAALRGMQTYGVSTTSSRETTGNTNAHTSLEAELAAFFHTEGAILTTEGYTANMALCETLGRSFRVALIDEKAHRSVGHAAEAAGLKIFRYRHRDAAHAGAIARSLVESDGMIILTDGVFTADGAVAPLPELISALPNAQSLLVVDDCHGFCVLGHAGRGTASHFGISDPRLVVTTTLAKGLGCYGGVIAGREELVQEVQNVARIYRGTTPCPPPMIEAARTALGLATAEPATAQRVRDNAAQLRHWLSRAGAPLNNAPTPIMSFVIGTDEQMDCIAETLMDRGYFTPVIEYPGGPAERYFRITVTARHTGEQIDGLGKAFVAAAAAAIPVEIPHRSAAVA